MSRALFDVNVLLAVVDTEHVHHDRAASWLEAEIGSGWASCAITQNGFVRVLSQPAYPKALPPREAIDLLTEATATDYHEFWPCSISVVDDRWIDRRRIHGPNQITDAYLLALATANGGRLVTIDRAVPLSAVPSATTANLVVL